MAVNSCIVVCGKKYTIGRRVVLWNEPGGLNGYDTSKVYETYEDRRTGKMKNRLVVSGRRYSARSKVFRNPKLPRLAKMIKQVFLHHSGMYRARDTFNVLHNQRGLSATFILDDDGVLYQTLDIREKAWHGGQNNPMSIGIEIDSRADVKRFPDAYDEAHQKKYEVGSRKTYVDTIQDRNIEGYEYTDEQYKTLISLCIVLPSIFPALDEAKFPQTLSGKIIKSVLKQPKKHTGYICHYNTKKSKWDPVSFDHERFLKGIETLNPNHPSCFWNLSNWHKRQYVLIELGYNPGKADGYFGPKTKKALQDFQVDNGLVPNGIWNKITEVAMQTALKGR